MRDTHLLQSGYIEKYINNIKKIKIINKIKRWLASRGVVDQAAKFRHTWCMSPISPLGVAIDTQISDGVNPGVDQDRRPWLQGGGSFFAHKRVSEKIVKVRFYLLVEHILTFLCSEVKLAWIGILVDTINLWPEEQNTFDKYIEQYSLS